MQFNKACICFFQNRKALRKENVNFFGSEKVVENISSTWYPHD